MKRLFLGMLLTALLIVPFSSASAMPLSQKASINQKMPYYLVVDKANQYVTAYKTGTNEVARIMICSTGKSARSTPLGTFQLKHDSIFPWLKFPHCYIRYGKRITGSIWFHSILYTKASASTLIQDSLRNLGSPASAGCIRLTPVDAQWISYNCKKGTTVQIVKGSKTSETQSISARLKNELKKAGHSGVQPNLSPTPAPTLSLGKTNTRVKNLHSRLRTLGFYAGSITNTYTDATKAAVEAYQAAAGLSVTGEADGSLQNKIAKDDTITGRLTTLKVGNKYIAVKALQKRLKALGFLSSSYKINTKFDTKTRSAVIAFQTMAGLSADGIATPLVQEALFANAAPTPTPTPAPTYATVNRTSGNKIVYLRKSKSRSSTVLAKIPSGKQVILKSAATGTWTKVTYKTRTGYVETQYLLTDSNSTPTPTPMPSPTPSPTLTPMPD